jgi:hypothetical protein
MNDAAYYWELAETFRLRAEGLQMIRPRLAQMYFDAAEIYDRLCFRAQAQARRSAIPTV